MNQMTISAATPGGGIDVVVGPFGGGLGVHLATGLTGDGPLYRIAHILTGQSIPGYFARKDDAVDAMWRILRLADWTKPWEEIPDDVRKPTMAIVYAYELVDVEVVEGRERPA